MVKKRTLRRDGERGTSGYTGKVNVLNFLSARKNMVVRKSKEIMRKFGSIYKAQVFNLLFFFHHI